MSIYQTDPTFEQFEIAMYYPYWPLAEVAAVTGYTVGGIKTFAARNGIKKIKGRFEPWESEYILANYNSTHTTTGDIANYLGRTYWSVINKYRELAGLRN